MTGFPGCPFNQILVPLPLSDRTPGQGQELSETKQFLEVGEAGTGSLNVPYNPSWSGLKTRQPWSAAWGTPPPRGAGHLSHLHLCACQLDSVQEP